MVRFGERKNKSFNERRKEPESAPFSPGKKKRFFKSCGRIGILGLVLCAGLVLCGFARKNETAEDDVERALELLEQAKSMETTLTLNTDLEVFRLKMGAKTILNMTIFQDPVKIKADMTMDMGILGSSRFQAYARKTGDICQFFAKEGEHWNGREADSKEWKRYDGKQMMETYLEQIDDLAWEGEEELPTGTAYRYTGVVHNTGLEKALLDTGTVEMLLTILEQDPLKPLGSYLHNKEDRIPSFMEKAGDMEVSLWIDKATGYPVQCAMDITDMVNAMIEEFAEADEKEDDSGETGAGAGDETGTGRTARTAAGKMAAIMPLIRITKTQIVVNCGDFNEAKEFTIPKEAIETLEKEK